MRWIVAAVIVLVVGCAPAIRDTFEVEVGEDTPVSALLSLCGRETPMRPSGQRFVVAYEVDCEGAGEVRLRYAGGVEVRCPVGYVTPNAGQHWRFAVQNRSCSTVPE